MTAIPKARIVLVTCSRCGKLARGPQGTRTCLDCITRIREQVRCPDCDSDVTIALIEGDSGPVIHADLRHDPTCPSWLATTDGDPDHPDILWPPGTRR